MSLIFHGADGQRQHGDERGWGGGGGPRRRQREQGAHALHPVAARGGGGRRSRGGEGNKTGKSLLCISEQML